MNVEIEIRGSGDVNSLRRRLGDSGGTKRALERTLDRTAEVAQSFAELNAPKDTTRLAGHISRDHASWQVSGAIQARVGVGAIEGLSGGRRGPLRDKESAYPFFVHEGTGVFGALHRRITPRYASAMRFLGRTGFVVTKSVAGQRPQPYIGEAFHEVQSYIPSAIDVAVRQILDGRP